MRSDGLAGGFPVVESRGYAGGAALKIMAETDAKTDQTENQERAYQPDAQSKWEAVAEIDHGGNDCHDQGDEPAGFGASPEKDGETAEAEDGQKPATNQRRHFWGQLPHENQGHGKEEENASSQSVGGDKDGEDTIALNAFGKIGILRGNG